MKSFFITLIFLVAFYTSKCQDSTKKWQASAELNFSTVPSILVSGSDTTSKNALFIAPSFSIRSEDGLGIIYSPYFITSGSHPGIFMHQVTVGLEQYGKKNYVLVADYSHFFFTGNNSIPPTPITNEILLSGTYKKLWLSPKFSAGIGFGTNKETSNPTSAYDIELAGGIIHYFDWKNENDFSFNVTPSILLNAGTNEYFSFLKLSKYISSSNNYKNFIKNPHATNKGRGNAGRTATTSSTSPTPVTQPISINNIEVNLESTVEHGSFSIRPVASVYLPISSTGISGYWELNVSYYF